jgi:hypothetical protein
VVSDALERFVSFAVCAADVAHIRAMAAKAISGEMTLILTLVVFDGYLLFPSREERSAAGSSYE